jgi:hypothetical protein
MNYRALLLLAVCGCTEDLLNPGGVEPTFTSLYGDYLANCGECHAPGAPGRTSDIEQTLDFTSRATAYATITTGQATGLTGNAVDCNGVPFLGTTAGESLLVATLDQPTRVAFDLSSAPGCDMDAISDETEKVGSAPSTEFISALKQWVNDGAANN